MNDQTPRNQQKLTPYLSPLGAWALAFGCAVGWGSFVMPGNTFLPIAGPVGAALGLGLGGLVMLILAVNYHYLMNRFPDGGGTYTYTRHCFGYDHGFLGAWFLILTYVAIIWANATALPLIARAVLGSTFQFGYLYEIAGFRIYLGEILLAVGSLMIAAFICLYRRGAEWTQIAMALLLLGGIAVCFAAAMGRQPDGAQPFTPAFAGSGSGEALAGTVTIFALAPWAFVGFESISHSAGEAKFPLKRTFIILAGAVVAAAAAYILLVLLACTALPEGCSSWVDYLSRLDEFSGVASQPTFHGASAALGDAGRILLGLAALGGIATGLIGNYVALSRLLCVLSDDGLFPEFIGRRDKNGAPANAILIILLVSVVFPFLGRTAISWIVDVTTVGATIAYALASASAFRTAWREKRRGYMVAGAAGMAVSLFFALAFLIPNMLSIKALSTESYLILTLWSLAGFVFFRLVLRHDRERRLGRSIVAWVVLLALIIFTSSVWMRQTTETAMERSALAIQSKYMDRLGDAGVVPDADADQLADADVGQQLGGVLRTMNTASLIQIGLIVASLLILLRIYSIMQQRQRQIEVEKIVAEESSRAKTSFLSNMSHEIRTPMNAIIGLDNIALRDPDLTPRTREHLEKIGASARHLLGLINDILDMSRIESGRMTLKNEEFSFREFLDQINIIINGQCQDKGLRYECNIVGHLSDYYCGDDMKLKQVLINILGNSVKFTNAPGNVVLTVEQTAAFEEMRTLRFIMRDTGIGMDKEFIPKIFDAFSQENATTTNRYGGSGLGMAITRNFVQMMNGDIQVESEKGVGSTFTVTVTLRASARSAVPEDGLRLPAGLRAMVVDDDEIACEHTQFVLQAIGVAADTALDPRQALDQVRSEQAAGRSYTLLITDYKMPAMTGLELVRTVRAFDGGRTAVIMLTGYNWDIIEDEAKADGVDGILAKPLFAEVLQREIFTVLSKRSGLESAEPPAPAEEVPAELNLAGRRVLMAEDVDQNAEILADLLDLEDILSERASNGQEAVDMFSRSEPGYYDAILMDVRMPVMDGLSATRAIRALPDRPDATKIPIIAMTANVFDEDVERSLQSGMNAHLSKPIVPERMYETMAKLIAESQE